MPVDVKIGRLISVVAVKPMVVSPPKGLVTGPKKATSGDRTADAADGRIAVDPLKVVPAFNLGAFEGDGRIFSTSGTRTAQVLIPHPGMPV
jgi:hypothetical protein